MDKIPKFTENLVDIRYLRTFALIWFNSYSSLYEVKILFSLYRWSKRVKCFAKAHQGRVNGTAKIRTWVFLVKDICQLYSNMTYKKLTITVIVMKYVTSECSTLLIIREMKMTMSYPLILVRMAIIERQKISSVGEYMNKPLYTVSE